MSMPDILVEITLRAEIHDALLGIPNEFREVFEIVLAYELADWDRMDGAAARLHVAAADIPALHLQSLEWARGILSGHPIEEIEAT